MSKPLNRHRDVQNLKSALPASVDLNSWGQGQCVIDNSRAWS